MNKIDLEMLTKAFPKELKEDVLAVSKIIGKNISCLGIKWAFRVSDCLKFTLLNGQAVELPYRIYYEECVDVAIEEAASKNWSLNSTKVLIHIADAPAHDEDINKWYNAVLKLSGMGIQMITVASSGVNKKTEYLFRAMTLITNGTYVAITNHSNVGDEHIDSSNSSDLVVEYLDNCLVRIINGYHSGVTYNPIPIN